MYRFKLLYLYALVRMLFAVANADRKQGTSFFRVFEKSWVRRAKRGYEKMFFKLAEEYGQTGTHPLPSCRRLTESSSNVLFIDVVTPSPSSDAGGYAAIQEIQLFQKLGFQVSFLPQNPSPDERARRLLLEELGVAVLDPGSEENRLDIIRRYAGQYRYIFITRYHIAAAFIDAIRWWSPYSKIILNLADLHYLRETRLAGTDPQAITTAQATKAAELAVISAVDMTLSYSQLELELLAHEGIGSKRLGLCPWVISAAEQAPRTFNERRGIAFLGGFKHLPNQEAVAWFVEQVLPLLRIRIPGCEFTIYGSHAQECLASQLDNEGVCIKGWVADIAEAYNHCRVFIAPLQSGAGVKGKVIGAFAHGVPTVLSPLAAEGIPLTGGRETLLAETPEQWVEQIAALYSDEQRWLSISQSALRLVSDEYSIKNGMDKMRRNLEQLLH